MEIEVVHVRNYGKISKKLDNGGVYIYCGRPSKLGNPYWMKDESTRVKVIEQYDNDKTCDDVVQSFIGWCVDEGIDSLKLGCFCAPKACHCDVIKRKVLVALNHKS